MAEGYHPCTASKPSIPERLLVPSKGAMPIELRLIPGPPDYRYRLAVFNPTHEIHYLSSTYDDDIDSIFKHGENRDRKPVRGRSRIEVDVVRPFYMSVCPVLAEQYERLSRGVRMPKVNVSWHEAVQFCQDVKGRLPTEFEWEWAAFGGEDFDWSGSPVFRNVAWTKENSKGRCQSAMRLKPNRFGLYDMSGNVEEWCNEKFILHSPGLKPKDLWVVRGGSFKDSMPLSCVWIRHMEDAGSTKPYRGFRIAFDIDSALKMALRQDRT